jgi:hypothetical protein
MVVGIASDRAASRVLVQTHVVYVHLDGPHGVQRRVVDPTKVLGDGDVLRKAEEAEMVSIEIRWTEGWGRGDERRTKSIYIGSVGIWRRPMSASGRGPMPPSLYSHANSSSLNHAM